MSIQAVTSPPSINEEASVIHRSPQSNVADQVDLNASMVQIDLTSEKEGSTKPQELLMLTNVNASSFSPPSPKLIGKPEKEDDSAKSGCCYIQ